MVLVGWVPRALVRALVGLLAGLLVALVVVGLPAGVAPAAGGTGQAQPVGGQRGFADPAVVRHAGGYVAVSTGPYAPRATAPSATGPWTPARPALTRLPGWASSPRIWAADVVRAGGRWLLYYSAPVRGLGPEGRCIGVARARDLLGEFRPVGRRPLVCPARARAPRAQDPVRKVRRVHARRGVIDPSGFRDRDGRRYLLYKTQTAPSTIRMVQLTVGGGRVMRGQRSHELVRRRGVTENPELVRRGRHLVLFTSEGYFGDCGYRTTYRRTTRLWRWEHSRRAPLLRRSQQGVCGPGGLDVLERRGARNLVYFHGWTCWRTDRACPPRHDLERRPGLVPQRSLFAGHLRWRQGRPVVALLRRQ
ncbi:family 43 glycosylhydrolase [Nocardioides sp. NPDC092400]|uniref:family 43 glycosylhydrolase n=1 Tax=Nocardioides sp. NPDC092400 TaxID=3155196 RepID=UPI00342C4C35